jgi:hypothetical protein
MSRTRTTDIQQPGWRKRIIEGRNATTNLSGSKDSLDYRPGYAWRALYDASVAFPPLYGLSQYEVVGCLCNDPGLPSGVDAATSSIVDNEAKARFIQAAVQAQNKCQGMVILGELGETLHQLRHPAEALRKGLNLYVKNVRRNLRKAATRGSSVGGRKIARRVMRETWLEWSFGAAPLAADVKSAAEALAALQDRAAEQSVSGFSKRIQVAQFAASRGGALVNTNILSWDYTQRQEAEYSKKYYGKVWIESSPEGKRLASQNFGFDFQNFFPTVWELIPYSFLVDYFTNIGAIIQCMSFVTARVRWVTQTTRSEVRCICEGFKLKPLTLTQYKIKGEDFTPPIYSRRNTVVQRTIYTGSLIPDFQGQIPGLSLRWLNIAALSDMRRARL